MQTIENISNTIPLVFVWIGHRLPNWCEHSLKLNKMTSGAPIVLLCERGTPSIEGVDYQIEIETFYTKEKFLDDLFPRKKNQFRDGFWLKTLERFFVLHSFMQHFSIERTYHAELDNLCFSTGKLGAFLKNSPPGFYCPRDAINRGIASLVLINGFEPLSQMIDFISDESTKVGNDMSVLGTLLSTNSLYFSLPTENVLSENFNQRWDHIDIDSVGGLFDAASIGQYLFGIDPRNVRGLNFNLFINENMEIAPSKYNFELDIAKKTASLIDVERNKKIQLLNVHVHSKVFRKICEKRFVSRTVRTANNAQRTFINYNFRPKSRRLGKIADYIFKGF